MLQPKKSVVGAANDHASRFGTEAQAAALGFMSPDGVHESASGYADQVQAFLQAISI